MFGPYALFAKSESPSQLNDVQNVSILSDIIPPEAVIAPATSKLVACDVSPIITSKDPVAPVTVPLELILLDPVIFLVTCKSFNVPST